MRYIALLRGINVGGNTMIKMSELKACCESAGFENVVSYINSGNLAFDAKGGGREKQIVSKLETAIEREFGKQLPVIVREQRCLEKVIEQNPFKGEFASHKEMHVLFMKEEMPDDKIEQLINAQPEGERFEVIGREIYCHLPFGVADSLLGKSFIEKKLKVIVTGRNWRTVEKLLEL